MRVKASKSRLVDNTATTSKTFVFERVKVCCAKLGRKSVLFYIVFVKLLVINVFNSSVKSLNADIGSLSFKLLDKFEDKNLGSHIRTTRWKETNKR